MLTALLVATLAVSPPLTPVSPRLINVAGEAQLSFPANQATVTLPITAKDRDAAGARKAMEAKSKLMQKALSAAGIDAKQIVMHENGLAPDYRGNEVIGQFMTRTYVITLTDLAKIDDTLSGLMRAAGVQSCSMILRNTDQRTFEMKARIAAAAAAKERAVNVIETLGGKLGLPRVVTDQSTASQGVGSAYAVLPAEGNTSINLVDLTITSHVTVQFDIRDEG